MQPLLGTGPAMLAVFDRIRRAAQVDSPVLVWGEPGSGRKLVAETIHRQSRRAEGPFVVAPVDDVPDALVEEALFGPAERASESECRGSVAAADGGTLLVEEVAGLPRTCQARLLEVAEGRPVGGWERPCQPAVDLRLMATARGDLARSVQRGLVRADLYYRLSVVTIRVPPLRERREDIPGFVRHLLRERCAAHRKPAPSVEPELMRRLVEHPWPGNVAQLRGCLDEMVRSLESEELGVRHLSSSPSTNGKSPAGPSAGSRIDTLAELEREAVMRALRICNGNRTQAAKALGISVRTLQRKLRHWGM